MQTEKLGTIDDYELALNEAIRTWSPAKRTALAAAMAERWLPVYEEFSAAEQWGDPAALRRSLEAVWDHVRGRALARADLARHAAQLDECTPHMDDFDALEALAACSILDEALKTCRSTDNMAATVMAALAGFEAAVPDWAFEPEEQPKLWKKVAARKELKKQLKVIERIEGLSALDDAAIKSLRKGLTGKELVGEASPAAKAEACPAGVTNQQLFEQYRRMVEADIRTQGPLDIPGVGFDPAVDRVMVCGSMDMINDIKALTEKRRLQGRLQRPSRGVRDREGVCGLGLHLHPAIDKLLPIEVDLRQFVLLAPVVLRVAPVARLAAPGQQVHAAHDVARD